MHITSVAISILNSLAISNKDKPPNVIAQTAQYNQLPGETFFFLLYNNKARISPVVRGGPIAASITLMLDRTASSKI